MKNEQLRLAVLCRRLKFEVLKSIGLFYLIDKIYFLKIKEPWNTLYKRTKYDRPKI